MEGLGGGCREPIGPITDSRQHTVPGHDEHALIVTKPPVDLRLATISACQLLIVPEPRRRVSFVTFYTEPDPLMVGEQFISASGAQRE